MMSDDLHRKQYRSSTHKQLLAYSRNHLIWTLIRDMYEFVCLHTTTAFFSIGSSVAWKKRVSIILYLRNYCPKRCQEGWKWISYWFELKTCNTLKVVIQGSAFPHHRLGTVVGGGKCQRSPVMFKRWSAKVVWRHVSSESGFCSSIYCLFITDKHTHTYCTYRSISSSVEIYQITNDLHNA